MIIDIHSHLAYSPIYSEGFLSDMFVGLNKKEQANIKRILPLFLKDKDGSKYLKEMDEVGIDKAVLLIVDTEIRLGAAQLSINDIFELHYNIKKNHEDRFIVFAGIDPRRGNRGIDLFKKSVFDYGFKGLKLYPPMGFSVDDDRLIPYYEVCSANSLPVLIHTGPSASYLDNQYADPILIKNVANHYKNITFILAHAANNLTTSLVGLLKDYNNIYIDLAGLNSRHNNSELEYSIFDVNINEKVLFGTDWPLFNLIYPVTREIDYLRQLFKNTNNVSKDALNNILFKNALKILK